MTELINANLLGDEEQPGKRWILSENLSIEHVVDVNNQEATEQQLSDRTGMDELIHSSFGIYFFAWVMYFCLLYLSISDATYADWYDLYEGKCSKIWEAVVCCSVISFVGLAFVAYKCYCLTGHLFTKLYKVFLLICFCISIWIQIIYFTIDEKCSTLYKNETPELWNVFVVNFSIFWIFIIIFSFVLCRSKFRRVNVT